MRMVQSNMSQYQGQFWYVSRKKVEMKKPLYLSLGVERKYRDSGQNRWLKVEKE
jgi:hypothetical protein